MNTCIICGTEFAPRKLGKNLLCSSGQCRVANMRSKWQGTPTFAVPSPADAELVAKLMAQPEITQLRPGIQTAIEAAFKRVLNVT